MSRFRQISVLALSVLLALHPLPAPAAKKKSSTKKTAPAKKKLPPRAASKKAVPNAKDSPNGSTDILTEINPPLDLPLPTKLLPTSDEAAAASVPNSIVSIGPESTSEIAATPRVKKAAPLKAKLKPSSASKKKAKKRRSK